MKTPQRNYRRQTILSIACISLALLWACEKKQAHKALAYYDDNDIETANWGDSMDNDDYGYQEEVGSVVYDESGEDVIVPFKEENGVKLIPVKVNGQMTVDMILDSGCSGTLISISEAQYLYNKGCLTPDDFLGTTQSTIADGSIVENMVVVLHELIIGDQICCSEVMATISDNTQAPLLLGNEVLNRAPAYKVDNINKVIRFTLQ